MIEEILKEMEDAIEEAEKCLNTPNLTLIKGEKDAGIKIEIPKC
jgi:hypothetical protein